MLIKFIQVVMNSSNPELQLEDNESAIRNKLKYLFTELNRFKFVTALALEFKKIESDEKIKYTTVYSKFYVTQIA